MRLVFVLCVILTFMQTLDFSIAQGVTKGSGISNKKIESNNKKPSPSSNLKSSTQTTAYKQNPATQKKIPPNNQQKPKIKAPITSQKSSNREPKIPRTTARGIENKKPQSNGNEQDTKSDEEVIDDENSPELELPPNDIIKSSGALVKTVKRQASKGGSGLINNLTRLVRSTGGVFGFLMNIVRNQSSNAKNIITYAGDTVSRSVDVASKGVIDTIKTSRTIGRVGRTQLSKVLKNTETLATDVTKLIGTTASEPLLTGSKVAKMGNSMLTLPNKSIDRLFNSIKTKLPKNEDENETDS